MKSRSGVSRIWRAFFYSWDGFRAALRHEQAFRQELALMVVLWLVVFFLPVTWPERFLLCGSTLIVLIVELLNSAIEACVDYISLDYHPLAKRAKDLGSAAVLLSFAFVICVWAYVLWGHIRTWMA